MSSFFTELKRRNVVRVGIAYAITGWIVVEIASVLLPIFNAPAWVLQVFTLLVILGAPIALIIAWAFELTPDGLRKTADVPIGDSTTHATGRKLDFIIIAVLVAAVVILTVDKFIWNDAEPEAVEVTSTDRPSVAVLPFANRSANQEDVFFVDGIHDDLLSHVSMIGSIKTISRTSVLQYRDTNKTIPQIAEELDVATVLEGGVQRAGDQVRINVQLIDAHTDEHLWAQIYDRRLTAANIFDIQSEIATAIASALKATLSPEEKDRIEKVPTENLEALEAYFLGKQLQEKRTSIALAEAVELLEKAVTLDPEFVLAYVSLADAYRLQANYAGYPQSEMNAKMQTALDKALRLDPTVGEAYATLANLRSAQNDLEGAEAAYRRALVLKPNYAPAYQWYGEFLAFATDRTSDALVQARRAVELDPRSPIIRSDLAEVLEIAGYFDEALRQYRKAIEIDPGFAVAYGQAGELYRTVFGRLDESLLRQSQSFNIDPGNPFDPVTISLAYLDLGDYERASDWLDAAIATGHESNYLMSTLARLHLHLGNGQKAIDFARRAVEIYANDQRSIVLLGDLNLGAGELSEVLGLYESLYPELMDQAGPEVNVLNYRVAIGLALALSKAGVQERADVLLNEALEIIQTIPRLGRRGYFIADVQIHAQRGQTEQALTALQQAANEGWRAHWRTYLEFDSSLNSVRDDAGFDAIVERIETDMAEQMSRVRELEASGEIVAPP